MEYMSDYIWVKKQIRIKLLNRIDFSRELSDEEIGEEIDELLTEERLFQCLSMEIRKKLRKEIFYSIRKLDLLLEI